MAASPMEVAMPDNLPTIWDRPPHTAEKHAILRRYLQAWFPKLLWTKKVIFIDGFAGPGVYSRGEAGSPLIAFDVAVNHKHDLSSCEKLLVFIESEPARFEHLERLINALACPPHVKVSVVNEDFERALDGALGRLEQSSSVMAPSFVMIDPFGWTGFPFALLQRLARHDRSEVFVSFMFESINRFILHPDQATNWDELFGCEDWRKISEIEGAQERREFLTGLYMSQLRSIGFRYLYPFEMRDTGNRTEYFLIFGSKSLDGLEAMKTAMWGSAPDGSFSFSDYEEGLPQLELFPREPDFPELAQLLTLRFKGRVVDRASIREFVLVDTRYLDTHVRRALAPLEKQQLIEVSRPSG